MSWDIEKGFAMKSAAPSRIAATASSTEPKAVTTTTVVSGWRALTRRSRSRPLSRGITRSVRRTSCRCCAKRAAASAPSSATSTTQPSLRRASAMLTRRSGSSSAISRRRPQMVMPSPPAEASKRGSQTRNAEPTPTRLVTSIRPPCAATMLSLTASPSPVPRPTPRVVKKGSKMRSRISGGMPRPVSRTSPNTWPSETPVCRVRVPPPGIACRAFSTRLRNSCSIWERSAMTRGSLGWRLKEISTPPLRS